MDSKDTKKHDAKTPEQLEREAVYEDIFKSGRLSSTVVKQKNWFSRNK